MTQPLRNKVAIITGAGKTEGMGLAAARKLASQGAAVVITDVCRPRPELAFGSLTVGDDFSLLERLAAGIVSDGGRAVAMAVDVTDREQVDGCVRRTTELFGGVDILFNNAGTAAGIGPFLDLDHDKWRLSFEVNVMGMVHSCQAVIPAMLQRGGGAIVNNSSLLGITAVAGYSAYAATKHAVIGLTKTLAAEHGPDGIRCNAICPGMIATQMGQAEARQIAEQHGISIEAAQTMMGEPAALRRCGSPDEVAEVVAFLVGPASSFLTGLTVPVSGGYPMGL